MNSIFYIFFFILGAIVGSFLNVVILRYNTGLSFAKGRSRCFTCGRDLSWSELVPVLSYIFLRGRCKNCKSKISWQYPAVELLTGLLFLATFHRFGGVLGFFDNPVTLLFSLIITSILIVIAVYDLRHKIIPDELLLGLGIIALIQLAINFYPHWQVLISHVFAGIIIALPFYLISKLSHGRLMGLGDPKFMLCLGLVLGLKGGISATVLAFWIGAIYGLVLMALSRLRLFGLNVSKKTELPFAPFLIIGFFLVFLFQADILKIMSLVL
jgi:prepilin signal peptidase PulO-like enzyme (type II secretory pathway)